MSSVINPSEAGKFALILPGSRAAISAVGKKKKKVFIMSVSKTQAYFLLSYSLFLLGGFVDRVTDWCVTGPGFAPRRVQLWIKRKFHSVHSVRKRCSQKKKQCRTTEYKLSKAIVQKCFYGTYAVPPI